MMHFPTRRTVLGAASAVTLLALTACGNVGGGAAADSAKYPSGPINLRNATRSPSPRTQRPAPAGRVPTCRWAGPSRTRSTATLRTPPAWSCRSPRARRKANDDGGGRGGALLPVPTARRSGRPGPPAPGRRSGPRPGPGFPRTRSRRAAGQGFRWFRSPSPGSALRPPGFHWSRAR